jgi:hypothetical protein
VAAFAASIDRRKLASSTTRKIHFPRAWHVLRGDSGSSLEGYRSDGLHVFDRRLRLMHISHVSWSLRSHLRRSSSARLRSAKAVRHRGGLHASPQKALVATIVAMHEFGAKLLQLAALPRLPKLEGGSRERLKA